ncbi:Mitotic apparatus protein p62 [Labeo rohita]|uniref:Mitotic apparatus protein p62 n=1 Tax=Labeo rohita TaxID=84645 RepID=A0ABQ8L4X5_LABRO|nr:Mitotic apparatus protein p62 [Labeo rohita]
MAVDRIIWIIQEKGEDAIRNVSEIVFLTEYCPVIKPLVTALNILQSETNMHLGWLPPVVFQFQAKLSRLETTSKMFIRVVQDGIEKCCSNPSAKVQDHLD